MQPSIEQTYPHVAYWVTTQGWIEVGYDEASRSFVRALDIGGMVWEGAPSYPRACYELNVESLNHARIGDQDSGNSAS